MARCLVTGGLGFIGSHVVDALVEAGHKVSVLDNLSTGSMLNRNSEAIFIEADIRDLPPLPEYDYVFHLASLARIQPSIDNPRETHEVNLDGTFNILEYCRINKAKIIFSSSSSLYEGDELPSKESSPLHAKNPYTAQKWAAEAYIYLYAELYNLDYVIFRYFNVFGERQILDGAYAALIGIFLDQKKRGMPLTITNNGEQSRDFTYVKDVARANLMAMNWQGTFNIGTGKAYSVNEVANMVGGDKKFIGKREGEVRATLADWTKAEAKGWRPTKDIKEWIQNENKT